MLPGKHCVNSGRKVHFRPSTTTGTNLVIGMWITLCSHVHETTEPHQLQCLNLSIFVNRFGSMHPDLPCHACANQRSQCTGVCASVAVTQCKTSHSSPETHPASRLSVQIRELACTGAAKGHRCHCQSMAHNDLPPQPHTAGDGS